MSNRRTGAGAFFQNIRVFEQDTRPRADPMPGVVAALLILCVYGGLALSVDFPRAAFGFQSDEATYYMMGQSLAFDRDLTYRREDLTRVWEEFPAGPSGVFLKRGVSPRLSVNGQAPFLHVDARPDPDTRRLFYGKSFAYPLFAAPFVAVLGTNGFLLLHALLLAMIVVAGYLFLNARMPPLPSLLLSSGFVMASVAPAYFVWITPEIFNLALVFLAYFCWLYKEVAPGDTPRWLKGELSDLLAALLLAVASFSKPSNVLLVGPMLLWLAWRRRWRHAALAALAFGAVVGLLFAANIGITGDWNFQGGERRTYYAAYPFQTADAGFDVGMDRATNRVLTDVIFDPRVFWTVFSHNVLYFFVGRYSGLVPYFFPAVFAIAAFALARGRRAAWQYLVLAAALAEILVLIIWIPYNYFGGGGVVGNRYFMNTYALFLFILPPLSSVAAAMVPWIVGSLFTAQIVLNPFYSSFYPAEAAKRGPLRWFPVELTLVNDLPINTNLSRVRVLFGERQRFQMYFLDDNAYGAEGGSFWVRGASTAEMLVKSAEPARHVSVGLTTGGPGTLVSVAIAGQTRSMRVAAGERQHVVLALDEGFPYPATTGEITRVWKLTITADRGFVPMFTEGGTDNRYLGVRVTPELVP
jgi:hypothetical protein